MSNPAPGVSATPSSPNPRFGARIATLALAVALHSLLVLSAGSFAVSAATAPGEAGGTRGDDVLTGTSRPDRIDALAGDDVLSGLAADDHLFGGFGRDVVRGGGGPDHLYGSGVAGEGASARDNGDRSQDRLLGGPGADHMLGGLGPDELLGQAGPDEIHEGAAEFGDDRSVDLLKGGAGQDVLVSTDASPARDRLLCGPGPDRAYADPGDRVSDDCEAVVRTR